MNTKEMTGSKVIKTKSLAQTVIEAWNTRSEEMILPLYSPEYTGEDITGGKMRSGLESVKIWMKSVFTAFPNIRYELVEHVEKDDQLVFHWKASGNHHGSYLKIPATGLPVSIQGMSMLKIKDGKIVEGKIIWDLAGVLRQLGLLPQMP